MSNQPAQTSVFTLNGYAVFGVKDSSGNAVAAFGNYVWNPNAGSSGLWIPAPVDANGVPQMSLAGSNTTKYGVVYVATTDTAQALPAFGCRSVMVIGVKGNQNPIYVGLDANVSATNYAAELDPKDQVTLEVANASQIYIYGISGDGVSYAAL